MLFRRDLGIAKQELMVAWNHFNNADPEFVDAAILKLNAAEKKYGALYSLSGAGNGIHFDEVTVDV